LRTQTEAHIKAPVALIVIGGNSLGVAVDHNAFSSGFPDCTHAEHTAVIKLHTAANPVGAAAQDNDAALALTHLEIVLLSVVGRVQVVGLSCHATRVRMLLIARSVKDLLVNYVSSHKRKNNVCFNIKDRMNAWINVCMHCMCAELSSKGIHLLEDEESMNA
jgi:hypothetical protein